MSATLELPPVLRRPDFFEEYIGGRTQYVNAYELTLAYGGPEEGGWWYDIGEPLASVPVSGMEEAVAAYTALHGRFAEAYADGDRHSVANRPELRLRVEQSFAASFPAERPRYE